MRARVQAVALAAACCAVPLPSPCIGFAVKTAIGMGLLLVERPLDVRQTPFWWRR